MWSKEEIKQIRDYCHDPDLDAGNYAGFLEEALNIIEYLQNEVKRLREGVECHMARSGEGTYECNVAKPCPACRLRRFEEKK